MMKRCLDCQGSGRIMGGGMLIDDCSSCDGSGKVKNIENEIDYLTIKQTESYQKAKARLKSKNTELSDDDAEKLLDEAFEKEKPIIKRQRKKVQND